MNVHRSLTSRYVVLGIVTATALMLSSSVWLTNIAILVPKAAFATAIGENDDDDSLADRTIGDVDRRIDERLSELPTIHTSYSWW